MSALGMPRSWGKHDGDIPEKRRLCGISMKNFLEDTLIDLKERCRLHGFRMAGENVHHWRCSNAPHFIGIQLSKFHLHVSNMAGIRWASSEWVNEWINQTSTYNQRMYSHLQDAVRGMALDKYCKKLKYDDHLSLSFRCVSNKLLWPWQLFLHLFLFLLFFFTWLALIKCYKTWSKNTKTHITFD